MHPGDGSSLSGHVQVSHKGQTFAKMEQEWMRHIDDYLDSSNAETDEAPLTIRKERKRLWDKVTSAAAAVGPTLDRQGQRIIVSTLCCIVFDLMIGTVKKYKLQHTDIEAASTSLATTDDRFQMRESDVSLYRYGGFALHSMLKKRISQQSVKSQSELCSMKNDQELQFLKTVYEDTKRKMGRTSNSNPAVAKGWAQYGDS